MAYYCEECSTWLRSDDAKMSYHNGRYVEHRYCDYDRKYRAADQNIYGCNGFVYVRRSLVTKICEILGIEKDKLFQAFDEVKESDLVMNHPTKMIDYNTVGPEISRMWDSFPQKEKLATNMLNGYIIPAEAHVKRKEYQEALSIYERMVKVLEAVFMINKESIQEQHFYDNLIKVH